MISMVDPYAWHGHEIDGRGFAGYKGHAGMDPDSKIISATTVTGATLGTTPSRKA